VSQVRFLPGAPCDVFGSAYNADGARALVSDAHGSGMHVVPSVCVKQSAPHGALEREPGLLRDRQDEALEGVLDYMAMKT
jgi:hypothetical protein